VNATVGGTGKYVLKQNTSGKADVWKKFSLVYKKGESGADDEVLKQEVLPWLSVERLERTTSGVSEQFLNGTSAHNRPFQCHYMVLRLKTKYT